MNSVKTYKSAIIRDEKETELGFGVRKIESRQRK